MEYKKIQIFIFLFLLNFINFLVAGCPDGKKSYEYLTRDPLRPFVLGFGTSMSQTHLSQNTMNPKFVRNKMLEIAKAEGLENGKKWLKNNDRYWYLLRSMPIFSCNNGHSIDISLLADSIKNPKTYEILDDIVDNADFNSDFRITKCPICQTKNVKIKEEHKDVFDQDAQNKLTELFKQFNSKLSDLYNMPNARLSIELADILKTGTNEIDEKKLDELVAFVNQIGNPILFLHHYTNPEIMPNLFSKESDLVWFSDTCAKVISKLPNITHVCPVSQPVGYAFRILRNADLPPFKYDINRDNLIKNIMKASGMAAQKMKQIRTNDSQAKPLRVLVSHQWKLFLPKHDYYDPRYALEMLVTKIADNTYNGSFTQYVKPYINDFDGIALSVYPAIKFNMVKPDGSNIAAVIDYEGSLGAITETNKAFPDKDIYIVEAGCNTADEKQKKDYIDMMLCACLKAREQGINVKSLFFWAITNDPDFYTEWNTPKGTTHFGPFDTMNPSSINEGGKYIKNIMESINF